MRFKCLFAKANAFANQVSTHQARNRGVNVHHRTASKVQRAVGSQQAAAPDHVRNRHVGESHPHYDEDQYCGEADTLGQRTDDQADGDAGEGALERNVNILVEATHHGGQLDIFQHHPVEVTEEVVACAERQRIAVDHPQDAHQGKGHGNLGQHRQYVFATDQAAVEQRNPWNGHKQHQRGADHHKGVIRFVGHGRSRHRQTR